MYGFFSIASRFDLLVSYSIKGAPNKTVNTCKTPVESNVAKIL